MKTPAEAIAQWKAGSQVDRAPLLRQLVEFDSWMPPISSEFQGDTFGPFEEQMLPLEVGEGELFYSLCSCWDASEAYRQMHPETSFGDRGGWEMFGIPFASANAILIDPGMPHEFKLRRQEFPQLQRLAKAVAVERAWKRLRRGVELPEDLAHVVGYGGYHLAAVQKPEGVLMIHLPHDDGGMFVPIFTHAEALALALAEFQRDFGDAVRTMEVSGPQAFPALAKETAQGIVVNPRGPTEPLAFGLGITALLLEACAPSG